jgi:hypothetical protein
VAESDPSNAAWQRDLSMSHVVCRQKGSHVRLTAQRNGEHHVTILNHDPLMVGTLSDSFWWFRSA